MKRVSKLFFGLLFGASAITASALEARSTQLEAVAFVKKAQDLIKSNGVDKAFAEFNRLEGPFSAKSDINKNGDLYIFTFDYNGVQVVHGKNPKMRGKALLDLRDADGNYSMRELIAKCKVGDGKGWVDYKWPNPVTKAVEAKSTYFERIPGIEVCIATGYYK